MGKRARRDEADLLRILETDPQQLKDIVNAFHNRQWTEETYMTMFSTWSDEELENARQKVSAEKGTIVAASALFNVIPAVAQMMDPVAI